LLSREAIIAPMMEATSTSETSDYTAQQPRRQPSSDREPAAVGISFGNNLVFVQLTYTTKQKKNNLNY
jgi:hypothetical protein